MIGLEDMAEETILESEEHIVLDVEQAGERLDVFCARAGDMTRSAAQRMIAEGDI